MGDTNTPTIDLGTFDITPGEPERECTWPMCDCPLDPPLGWRGSLYRMAIYLGLLEASCRETLPQKRAFPDG